MEEIHRHLDYSVPHLTDLLALCICLLHSFATALAESQNILWGCVQKNKRITTPETITKYIIY